MVVKVEVHNDGEQWCARAIGADLLTCAPTLDELMVEVKDAAACHYHDPVQAGQTST
ncbi:type II toxin-antitoxin system HicB family antitoxin [candidate division WOR-3 bacterium]|uniref:Type II toxin-antitoxin system HicB family antitoxin n=1 Tax=candidate division WOR-3 bacterium TaxID=2052148 RepID=A0A937XJX3_UNCW3|nr:type II toxin-antitoxin system HicB family antitoxin [candidate division WOR-3 bacterium]